jgi:hypothetical protein
VTYTADFSPKAVTQLEELEDYITQAVDGAPVSRKRILELVPSLALENRVTAETAPQPH